MKNVLRIILFFFVSISAFSQGVCDLTTGVERGAFDAPTAVCLGEAVNVKDRSGGTDIKYIFGYRGQAADQLTPTRTTPDADWAFAAKGEYTILQYGKKGGKDMYICKKVVVRENSEPVFSYSQCNNDNIEITIANVPANNFDYYTVDWGDGNPTERVNPTDLPFKKVKGLPTPRTIIVNGAFNTASTCAASTAKTIPAKYNYGYDDPYYSNIKQLALEGADKAVLTISGSYDPNGYEIYMTPRGVPYDLSAPIRTGILPGDVSISIPDTTQSYCFFINRQIACGTENSAEICTVVLSDVNRIDNTAQEIIWDTQYPTELPTNMYPDRNYGRYVDNTSKLVKTKDEAPEPEITISTSPYIDNIDCKKKYCYRIKTEISGQIYYTNFTGVSLSKLICVAKEDFHPPKITDAFVSVNTANASEIRFNDNSSWTLLRDKYLLYHDNGTAFTEILSNPVEAPFTDATVDNSLKQNCYKVAFVDECGSTSELSDPFCTIFLSEPNKNQLGWTGQTPFADINVSSYEVEGFDENTSIPSVVTSPALPATQLEYVPNLSSFLEEAEFRIKTTRADGSVSYSNTYTIPISVKLLLPDIFTPNNDSYNDILQLKGTFRRITEFEFQIYNRWGNPVFTSDDPLRTWDGNFQGTMAPADIYTYKIYAKISNGTEVSKTGKFLLMR